MAVPDGGVESEQAMGEAALKTNGKATRASKPRQVKETKDKDDTKQQATEQQPKQPKEKKPKSAAAAAKATIDHPPYLQMVMEAISSLKERTGSSQYAIAKYLEDKYKSGLPPSFKRILSSQLKNLSSRGKLTKVKNSFKLSTDLKSSVPKSDAKKPTAAAAKAPAKVAKPKSTRASRSTSVAAKKTKSVKPNASPKASSKAVKPKKRPAVSGAVSKSPAAKSSSSRSATARSSTRAASKAAKEKMSPNKPKKAVTASKRARRVAK